jgi:catechol 2,3-dioxygenase-like lactoylglutathione lyase family enzyme
MSKKRTGTPWMPAADYAATLQGLGINLMVRDIERSLAFHRQVLGANVLYHDVDFAALEFTGSQWMLHAWHTYDDHPLHRQLTSAAPLGIGAELRLYGRDPDEAEQAAVQLGCAIVQSCANKAHGLRECFIEDPDGYLWAPGVVADS